MERNEAIESLRQLYSDTSAWNKAALECLIPELKESEDERIRKEIIDFINYYRHNTDLTTEQAKWCKEALDWLKKQNERDVKVISWREPDDCADILEGHLVVIAYKYGVFGLGHVAGGKVICHSDMGQKPWAILYIPNSDEQVIIEQKEKQKEQKPAEWSEEDEKMRRRAICACNFTIDRTFSETHYGEARDWLKSLPERLNLQPKQEWSEEDTNLLNRTLSIIRWASDSDRTIRIIGDEGAIELENWLKSLRSRPKSSGNWKPSEEQMCELNWASKLSPILESLYNDLKKLI